MPDTNKKNNDCDCYNKPCKYCVPIKLCVPIILDFEVFANNPNCHPQGEVQVRAASESASDAAASEATPAPETPAAA